MRTRSRILLLVWAWAALAICVHAADKPLALSHVKVIDTRTGALSGDTTVLIRGKRIVGVGRNLTIPADTTVVNGHGNFLIPGLWDMHVHTNFGDWLPGGKEVILPLFVANGVTGVRDMGGDLETLKLWRQQIKKGAILGPAMVISGPMLDGPTPRFPASVSISSSADAVHAVERLRREGADFIKIQSLIPRDAYFAAAKQARQMGITFVGHVPDAVRASEASDAGQKSIEHLTGVFEGCSTAEDQFLRGPKGPRRFLDTYSSQRGEALFKTFAQNQTWQVPTLIWERGQWLIDRSNFRDHPLRKYVPDYWREHTWQMFTKDILRDMDTDPIEYRQRFVEKELQIVGRMRQVGVRFMAGTDTAAGVYVLPGFSLHDELALFVRAGFSPLQALQTATLNPALFLARESDYGTVSSGKVADLLLLSANPLVDIGNTRAIEAVVLEGRLLTRKDLDAVLNKVQTAAAALKPSTAR
jgi:imidazolonepropionase-like amidohydrolase